MLAIPVTEKEVEQETALIEQSAAAKVPLAIPPMFSKILSPDEISVISLVAGMPDNALKSVDEAAVSLGRPLAEVIMLLRSARAKMQVAIDASKKSGT